MSTIVRYSSGSTYTLVANKVEIEKVQDLGGQYHIPYSSIVGMMRLGLGIQKITVSGDILDMAACIWHDVVAISFDSGVSYQTVYFAGVPYTSDCWSGIYPYALSLLASPLKEQTAVRYPTTGYKWGNQSISGISQAGNVPAYPTIRYLAPLFYAPLSNTLVDFAGQSVTFTRTAAKVHGGVTYPINTPIFDNGLYLASDTAQDVATWTPPASTVRTVVMQIKRASLSILEPFSSLDTSKWIVGSGTVITTGGSLVVGQPTSVYSAAHSSFSLDRFQVGSIIFSGACLPRETAAINALGLFNDWGFTSLWSDNGNIFAAGIDTGIAASATLREFKITFLGNGTANLYIDSVLKAAGSTLPASCQIAFKAYAGGAYIRVDQIQVTGFASFPATLTVWNGVHNTLRIDTVNNLLKWDDAITTVSLALPAAYLSGTVMDVVLLDDTSHAVTLAVHPAGGAWTSATGTLALLTWPQLTLGPLEGSIANLIQYPYVLTAAEYQALAYSSLSLLFNALYVGNRYAGEVIKGSDKRLLNANGSDISALLGGTDIPISASAVTIAQSQGLSARWYVEVKRTDV